MTKICKIHGELAESDLMWNRKEGSKYRSQMCRICRRSKNKVWRDNNREKQIARRQRMALKYKTREKKPKICKKHGLISPDLQTSVHKCFYCVKEQNKSTKENNAEKIKVKDRERNREKIGNLEDGYVKSLLIKAGWERRGEIPIEIVELKRTVMKIKRRIKEDG